MVTADLKGREGKKGERDKRKTQLTLRLIQDQSQPLTLVGSQSQQNESKAVERDGLRPPEIPEAVLWTKIHIYSFLNYHNPKFNYPKYKK